MNKIKIFAFVAIIAVAFSGVVVFAQNQNQAQNQAVTQQMSRIQQQGISSRVMSIDNSNITIRMGAVEYTVNAESAAIKNMEGTTLNVSDIKTGDLLLIKGTLNDQVISATEITVRNIENMQENANAPGNNAGKINLSALAGKITNIAGPIITMTDIQDSNLIYTINANAVETETISNLKVGDMIEVSGNISIIAKTISLKNSGVRAGFLQQIGNFFSNIFKK